MAGDSNYSNKLLHLLGEGTNGSTTIVDSSPRGQHIVPIGSGNISTTQAKYGSSSLYCDGSADGFLVLSQDLALGTADFTLRLWYYPLSFYNYAALVECRTNNADNNGFGLGINSSGACYLVMNNSFPITTSATLTLNSWNHIALCKSSGIYTVYVGGSASGGTYSNSSAITSPLWGIGIDAYAYNIYANGYMDDVSLETGAVISGNFTPAELYTYAGQITGNITESLAVAKWRVTATRCSDGTFAGSTTTTGSTYTINCNTTEACNVTLAPHVDRKWATGYTPVTGEFWVPSNPDTTPHLFECTTSGAVGGSEPTWNTMPSATTSDGSAVWTCVGPLPTPKALGPRIPS